MGKITGFLEIDRRDRKYKPVPERLKSYQEFVIPLGDEGTREQAARVRPACASPSGPAKVARKVVAGREASAALLEAKVRALRGDAA